MDDTKSRQRAWEVFAQVWVDTSYDEQDLAQFAGILRQTGLSPRELRRIAYFEVCGAFATFSVAVLLSAGMALPDWLYPEAQARREVADWLARPLAMSLLNPVWLLGYPLAVGMMRATMGPVLSRVKGGD